MGKGISISVIAIVVVAILGAALYSYQNFNVGKITEPAKEIQLPKQPETQKTPTNVPKSEPYSKQPSEQFGASGCVGKGTVNFTSPPRLLEDIEIIQPIGLINANSGHVTPTDHGYYYPPNWKPQDNPSEFKDVLSPADGTITTIQLVANRQGDYRLIIHHTCTFYTIYIHVKELSPKIAQAAGEFTSMTKNTNIPVKAGEVIGRANSFDFSVNNDEITLPGFVFPEHYNGEPWKVHTDDMFAYFVEPIKSQLLSKNMRTAEPLGGKIDYDIDGRLVGNWFKQNTNWYAGIRNPDGSYWQGHLTIVPDALDPTHVIFATGDFGGESKQFGIKGNPNPATVSKSSGIIKYELVTYDYYITSGQPWNHHSLAQNLKAKNNDNDVHGFVLLQLMDDRKLKVEVFPGKTASEVTEFTNSIVYER